MPRDLEQEGRESKRSPPVTLTESPNSVLESPESQQDATKPEPQREFVIIPQDQQIRSPTNLHPYTRLLTISDLDSCEALENAAFSDPNERGTREKFRYRLTKCGELCLGIFCTAIPGSDFEAETLATGHPIETSRRNGAISVLLGHIVATKTEESVATDDSMGYPKDWESPHSQPGQIGHKEGGRTIVLHSVAILPKFQGRGLGTVLIKAYMQQMSNAGIADRLAIIAHAHKIAWYEKLGFVNKGKGSAQFGGGGWFDLVYELKPLEARTTYG